MFNLWCVAGCLQYQKNSEKSFKTAPTLRRGFFAGVLAGLCLIQAGILQGQSTLKNESASPGQSTAASQEQEKGKDSPPEPKGKATEQEGHANQQVDSVDLNDYLRKLLHKPPKPATHKGIDLTVLPYIGSQPPLGMILGVGASFEFPLGDPAITRISVLSLGVSFSTSKQMSITWSPNLYGNRNRWQLQGDNHFQLATQNTYGLGTSTHEEDLVRTDFHSLRFFDTWYFQIRRNLYVGAGFRFARQSDIHPGQDFTSNWEETPFVNYSQAHGFDLKSQTSTGPSLDVMFDNRDNQNDPARGVFAATSYRTYFKGFLGGSSQWQDFYADARTYRPLSRDARHRLALWGYADLVTGGTAPYFSLPATDAIIGGRAGRGYAENRFRGEQLLYAEAEYRATLTRNGFFGMVFYANATTVSSSMTSEHLFDSGAVGGGFGFRFRLQKRSKTNLRVDFGFGREGSRGILVGLGEAF